MGVHPNKALGIFLFTYSPKLGYLTLKNICYNIAQAQESHNLSCATILGLATLSGEDNNK